MTTDPGRAAAGPAVNYVPNQVCVVVRDDGRTGGRARYEEIRRAVNGEIRRIGGSSALDLFDRIAQGLKDDLRADLTPSDDLTDYLDAELLQPLAPPDDVPGDAAPTPWITLSGRDQSGAPPATLCFYQIGGTPPRFVPPGDDAGATELAVRHDRTRQMVNLLNQSRDHLLPTDAAARIVAVTPNWLTAIAPFTEAGPGAKPEGVPPSRVPYPGRWSVRFVDADLSAMVSAARATEGPSDVVVAILDSCPTADEVAAAAARHRDNDLLQQVANSPRVHIDEPGRSIPAAYFQRFDHVLPNWRDLLTPSSTTDPAFLMKDHGLFAAGLVHDIVPGCDVHLIRVLSDYGIGDLWTLAAVLMRAPELIGDRQRLVVNLSLGVAIPPGERFLREWLPTTYAGLEETVRESPDLQSALETAGRSDVQETLDGLHAPLKAVVDWLAGQDRVLLVAAAGNDNDDLEAERAARSPLRPEPRWPARYDRVFGVAAVDTSGQPSRFSNRGDVRQIGNGVATLGGDTSAASAGAIGAIEVGSGGTVPDAVVGVYSAKNLPLGGGANDTGWAYWAGTSFATPIVSAVAACLWAQPRRSAQSGSAVIADVRNSFAQNTAAAGSDRLDVPTIAAHQDYVPS